jgi:hypothetical protein
MRSTTEIKKERPVCASFCLGDVAAVVDGEEDVGGSSEIRECFAEGAWIGGLEDHE